MINPLQRLVDTIDYAVSIATDQNHEYVTLEHLAVATIADAEVRACLKALNIDWKQITGSLDFFFDNGYVATSPNKPNMTDDFQEVIMRAVAEGMFFAQQPTTPLHLLRIMLRHPAEGSHAVTTLLKAGLSANIVSRYMERDLFAIDGGDDCDIDLDIQEKPASQKDAEKVILKYCTDLNALAGAKQIDPLIGRATEVEEACQTLCRRTKKNIVFVGEPGVGKTAIAEGIARRIVEGSIADVLKGATVYSLDLGKLIAGTRYRGDFEERMTNLLGALELVDDAILFIDEIHMIMNAGAGSAGAMDVANLLKASLAKGRLRCIGATTLDEFRKHFEKDRALLRRFKRHDVNEPSPEDAKLILRGLKQTYEAHHGLEIHDDALDMAVDLAVRYISKGQLPDKAIDIVDNAFAKARLIPEAERPKVIARPHIEAEVAKVTRIPRSDIAESEHEKLERLHADLSAAVFDQDGAINGLVDAMYVSGAGLRGSDKTIGSYLFCGPTGVGKTEVAEQLAKTLGIELVRFDMADFTEPHSVARLTGAPPGYVGFDQGGLLTNAIDAHPHCVLLLDEIEKAHPNLYNLLLPIMDKAVSQTVSGKKIDFRNVILIMTSNVGATSSASIGFDGAGNARNVKKALEARFAPEFRERLDEIIAFEPLSPTTIRKVVRKFLGQLATLASHRHVNIDVNDEAVEWLMERGYDKDVGARLMGRTIARHVKKPLSRLMLSGDLQNGGIAKITILNDQLIVTT